MADRDIEVEVSRFRELDNLKRVDALTEMALTLTWKGMLERGASEFPLSVRDLKELSGIAATYHSMSRTIRGEDKDRPIRLTATSAEQLRQQLREIDPFGDYEEEADESST